MMRNRSGDGENVTLKYTKLRKLETKPETTVYGEKDRLRMLGRETRRYTDEPTTSRGRHTL